MARTYDRFLRQRLSRRRLLAGASATALGAAALYACGGDGDGGGPRANVTGTPGPSPEGTPRSGGILHLRQEVAYPNFNPFGPGINAIAQGLFLGFAIFDHFWYVPTDTGEVVKFLATDYEVIDAQTVRVTIGDAVFHNKPPVNGRKVVASDVKTSAERFREEVPLGFSWLQEVLDRIEIPDDKTVVYHQKRPWAWFFTSSNAGSPWTSSILPEEILDRDDLLNDDAIGSGRWVLAGHDAGTNVRLRKFEHWREPGLPYLDGVYYVFAPDDTLAQAAFSAKDIDVLAGLNREEQDALVNRFRDQIVTSSDLSRAYRCVMIKDEEPFRDPRVRQGISLAVDRQEMMQILDLGDGELSGPVPPAHKRYVLDENDPDLQEYVRHYPAEAKAMLEGAGFPFDQETVLKYSDFQDAPDLAEVLAQQLRRIGLKIKLPGAEPLPVWFTQTLIQGNFQMTSFTHLPYEDPYLPMAFYLGSSTAGQPNPMGYKDDEVDEAILAAASELDEEQRIELTKDAQRLLIRKWAPMLNFYSPLTFVARWSYYKCTVEGRGSFGLFNSRSWLDK